MRAYGTTVPVPEKREAATTSRRTAAVGVTLGLVLLGSLAAFYGGTPGATRMAAKAVDVAESADAAVLASDEQLERQLLTPRMPSSIKGKKKKKKGWGIKKVGRVVNKAANGLNRAFSRAMRTRVDLNMGKGNICCSREKQIRMRRKSNPRGRRMLAVADEAPDLDESLKLSAKNVPELETSLKRRRRRRRGRHHHRPHHHRPHHHRPSGECKVTTTICIGTTSSRFIMDARTVVPRATLKLKPQISVTIAGDCDGDFTVGESKEQPLLAAHGAKAEIVAGYEFKIYGGLHGSITMTVPANLVLRARVAGAFVVPDRPSASVGSPRISPSVSAEVGFSGQIFIGFAASGLNVMSLGANAQVSTAGSVVLGPRGFSLGRPSINVDIVATCGLALELNLPSPNICGTDITFGIKAPSFSAQKEQRIYRKTIRI